MCYHNEEINLDGDVLFPWIEKTVLMTMSGSPRREQYMQQLEEFKPSKRVIIQHNLGYQKCAKENVASPQEDVVHSTRIALAEKCWTLLLEDDVEFCSRIKHVAKTIHVEDGDAFSLGASIIVGTPGKFPRVLFGAHTHAIIYSPKACATMQIAARKYLDVYLPMQLRLKTFYKPLAVQKLNRSELSGSFSSRSLLIHIFGADTNPELFYNVSHMSSQVGGFTGLCILIVSAITLSVYLSVAKVASHSQHNGIPCR